MNTYSLKLALRNLLRHQLSSTISILGLTIGFTAFILIMLLDCLIDFQADCDFYIARGVVQLY